MTRPYSVFILLLGFSAPGLSACDLYQEGHLTHERMQAIQESTSQDVPVSAVDNTYIRNMADEYARSGVGPMQVSVTYDPQSDVSAAGQAGTQLNRIVQGLHREGVGDIAGSVLPIHGQGSEEHLVVTYPGYKLLPPKDCTLMEGFEGREVTLDEKYRLGCTLDTVMTRQIARPKDMANDTVSPGTADGRRASNIVDVYRTGVQNKPLEGESASDSE